MNEIYNDDWSFNDGTVKLTFKARKLLGLGNMKYQDMKDLLDEKINLNNVRKYPDHSGCSCNLCRDGI